MRKTLIASLVLFSLTIGPGCESALRDAALDGISVFVTDTIAGTLEALFPVSRLVQTQTPE